MKGFIIRRDGHPVLYVAPPGSRKSYIQDPLKARRFRTRAEAEADACGNERVVALADL